MQAIEILQEAQVERTKGIESKDFNFRSHIISFGSYDYQGETKYYLGWVTKANRKYNRRGHHSTSVVSREDAARKLNYLRSDLNKKWSRKMEKVNAKREAKQNFVNPYKVNQILHTSWGYDQTNIEYYQVIKVNKMSIVVREIGSYLKNGEDSFMSGSSVPEKDKFIGEESTHIIQVWGDGYHNVSDKSGHGMYNVSGKDLESGIRCSWYA